MSRTLERHSEPRGTERRWSESGGDFSILAGTSLVDHCEPHFHETYVIAHLRKGEAEIQFRDRAIVWTEGQSFLANPYELVSGGCADGDFVYDVCYPCQAFMAEAFGKAGAHGPALPRLSLDRLLPRELEELSAVLAGFSSEAQTSSSAASEQELIRFIRWHPTILADELSRTDVIWVRLVHELVEQSLDVHLGIMEIAALLRCDRSHLMRVFRKATGLPPSSYVRQLRLARALEHMRSGGSIADTAAQCGFADQAHFTREFKRIYGTTPGKLARDLLQ